MSERLYTPEGIRELLHRRGLAAERHRNALGRLLGMNATEAAAVAHLARAGHLTPAALGRLLGVTSGGMTALAQRLERDGIVERRSHPRDRRSALLSLSPQTVETARDRYGPLVRELDAVATALSAEDLALVGRYLSAVVMIAERHADQCSEQSDEASPSVPAPGLWA